MDEVFPGPIVLKKLFFFFIEINVDFKYVSYISPSIPWALLTQPPLLGRKANFKWSESSMVNTIHARRCLTVLVQSVTGRVLVQSTRYRSWLQEFETHKTTKQVRFKFRSIGT